MLNVATPTRKNNDARKNTYTVTTTTTDTPSRTQPGKWSLDGNLIRSLSHLHGRTNYTIKYYISSLRLQFIENKDNIACYIKSNDNACYLARYCLPQC